jgi:hypothetical protein
VVCDLRVWCHQPSSSIYEVCRLPDQKCVCVYIQYSHTYHTIKILFIKFQSFMWLIQKILWKVKWKKKASTKTATSS